MKVDDLKPGDLIRVVPQQYRVIGIEPWTKCVLVEDSLCHRNIVEPAFIEDWWEKVGT